LFEEGFPGLLIPMADNSKRFWVCLKFPVPDEIATASTFLTDYFNKTKAVPIFVKLPHVIPLADI